jgi:hypothetical protein
MLMQTSGGEHVDQVIQHAHKELQTLLTEKQAIIKKIGTLKQTIVGLANLFGDDLLNDELQGLVDRKSNGRQPGFTKTCRTVLMESERPLLTQEVCEQIKRRDPALLARHKEPLASVTTVLNRLVSYGEARRVFNQTGQRAWQWVAEPRLEGGTPGRARHNVSQET